MHGRLGFTHQGAPTRCPRRRAERCCPPGEPGAAAHPGRRHRHLRGPGFRRRGRPEVGGGRGVHPVDSLGLAGCHPAPGGRSAKRRSCGGGFCCLRHPRRGGTGQL